MNKKYELLKDDTKQVNGKTLYRIKALVAIGSFVAAGDLGGYIEKEENLSHVGNSWVSDNGQVSGFGLVSGSGQVSGHGHVYGNGRVSGDSQVSGHGQVYGNGRVSGSGQVSGHGHVYGNGRVSGDSQVSGHGQVYGNGHVYGNGRVSGNSLVSGSGDLVWFSNVGSENGTLTVAKTESGLFVSRGCFFGTDIEFLDAVNKTHGKESKIGLEYNLLIEVARSRILG